VLGHRDEVQRPAPELDLFAADMIDGLAPGEETRFLGADARTGEEAVG
jgi:hypothetical protein